jgi:O-antigen/teichoic acid export membrane protein
LTVLLNLILTGLSKFYNLIAAVVFAPLYLEHLGIEAFAVISAAIVISAILGVLDSGISPLVLQDLGSFKNDNDGIKRLLGSYELVYLSVFGVLLSLYGALYFISNHDANFLSLEKYSLILRYSLVFVLEFCFQLGCRFYIAALQGLERHVTANIYYLVMAFLRTGFIVIILSFVPTLDAYFYWQLLVSVLFLVILRRLAYGKNGLDFSNPFIYKKLFWKRLLSLRKMALIACVAVLYGQADRFVFLLSSDLIKFPLYTVAGSFALIVTSVGLLLVPLVLPKLNFDSNSMRKDAILRVTHTSCYLLSAVLAVHLVTQGPSILGVFFDDPIIIHEANRYLVLLIIGNYLSSITIALYIRNVSDSRFNDHLAIVGTVAVFSFPLYFLLHNIFGMIGIPIGFVISQLIISILYVTVSAKAIFGRPKIFQFLIVPLIVVTMLLGVNILIHREIGSLESLSLLHPYLKFCVSIVPIALFMLMVAPFVHFVAWHIPISDDFRSLNSAE